jgi:trans-aconitate methyltransferase
MNGICKRTCPLCNSDHYTTILILQQDQFVKVNPSYRIERISELKLDSQQQYPIVHCTDCGMVYTHYKLDTENENLVYERIIDHDASRKKIMAVNRRRYDVGVWSGLLDRLQIYGTEHLDIKIVDYGCGWGTLLLAAEGPGVKAFGFDVTSWKINWAREQGLTIFDNEESLAQEAPFDAFYCTSVLEHLNHPREALQTLSKLLKQGACGYITAMIPFANSPDGWTELNKRISSGLPLQKEINPWEHLNYFTVDTFRTLLSETGFQLESEEGYCRFLPQTNRENDIAINVANDKLINNQPNTQQLLSEFKARDILQNLLLRLIQR